MLANIKYFLLNPLKVLNTLVCKIRCIYLSGFIDEGDGKIIISDPFIKIKIKKGKNSKLIIRGDLIFQRHLFGTAPIVIVLSEYSVLEIKGDFIIGDGVKIFLENHSELLIKGRNKESGSGITSNSLITVNKKITIGEDFLCAWGVFISDSDWHTISGQVHQADIIIGDHVWVANNSNILKGSIIGDNCIVAGQSKVINYEYPANVLIAGSPGKIVKTDISWSRDIF